MADGSTHITSADLMFSGDDKVLEFIIYTTPAKTVCVDVAGFGMSWIASRGPGDVVIAAKTTVNGSIAVVGTFNSVPASNTQRVRVTLNAADTAALCGGLFHELRRTDVGLAHRMSSGEFYVHERQHV